MHRVKSLRGATERAQAERANDVSVRERGFCLCCAVAGYFASFISSNIASPIAAPMRLNQIALPR